MQTFISAGVSSKSDGSRNGKKLGDQAAKESAAQLGIHPGSVNGFHLGCINYAPLAIFVKIRHCASLFKNIF
jgi:hypothetical protein